MHRNLALSPTPLDPETRAQVASMVGGDVQFADLATLRRQGVASAIRQLRTMNSRVVVSVAVGSDQLMLGDTLVLASLLVPAEQRLSFLGGDRPGQVRSFALPIGVSRIVAGTVAGVLALARNSLTAARLLRRPPSARAIPAGASRCLYLKPTLQFGMQVGGSVAHVAGVVNALAAEGFDVRMLANGRQPMVSPAVSQCELPPRFLPAYPFELNSHRYHRAFCREAGMQAESWKPEFIYQRYVLNDLTGARLSSALDVPLILEFNGSEVWVQRHWGKPLRFERSAALIERANLHAADVVVTVSDAVRDQIAEIGVSPEKVLVYPNCVDTSIFDPTRFESSACAAHRRALGVPADALLFTFVGTFGKWHGAEVLARAIRALADAREAWLRDCRAHFAFIGDGLTRRQVEEILAVESCAGLATFAGLRPQEETPLTLAASDILVSPHVPNDDGTPFFGSPTKLFEYLAMARPIIASDLDQIGQVMRGWRPCDKARPRSAPSEFGLLVQPGNVGELADALGHVASLGAAERGAMGASARAVATRAFSWGANVQAVLASARRVSSVRR